VQSFVLDKILYPNNLYIERNEINDNKTLIGLSEEEVIDLLGEPKFKKEVGGLKHYTYNAGITVKKSIFEHTKATDVVIKEEGQVVTIEADDEQFSEVMNGVVNVFRRIDDKSEVSYKFELNRA
jgi:hypothetical protein